MAKLAKTAILFCGKSEFNLKSSYLHGNCSCLCRFSEIVLSPKSRHIQHFGGWSKSRHGQHAESKISEAKAWHTLAQRQRLGKR